MGFAPKFWARGGDLRRPFAAMLMDIGGDFTSRWWRHISTICDNRSFSTNGGGDSKT